jgi:hypothetical protein
MFKTLSLLLLCLLATQANAYLITNFKANEIDYNLPTRLLIAGDGHDLGTLFQEVAKAKALKYRELNPTYQIVFITYEEKDYDDKQLLKNWGFNLQRSIRSSFDGDEFLEQAVKFNKLASVDFFSHSSAQHGIHLGGGTHRLDLGTKGLEALKGHFMKDAFVFLHGCNTGFYMAPFLSRKWEVPVAGSMTSTNFQKLHSDGNFYLNESQYAPNSDWATVNNLSFLEEQKCRDGACLRLKPVNQPYVGFWGEYRDGGLPFYKFFCIKNSNQDCERVMAKSLLSFVGAKPLNTNSTFENYKKNVLDFLCPISAKRDIRRECEENLENALVTGDETYNPFSDEMVQCNFQSCEAEITCKKIFIIQSMKPGTCVLTNNFKGKATTLVREYKAYLQGFKSLNN